MPTNSSLIVCAFIIFNIVLAAWRILAAGYQWRARWSIPPTNWDDTNYPLYFSLPPTDPVVMSLHESSRFSLQHNETVGDREWMSVISYTREGRVQFGSHRRAFMPAYYHQFHCLRGLQRSIVFPGDREDVNALKAPDEHVHHCLNYLRQLFICSAVDSIEKGDFIQSDFEEGTVGDDLVCQDWDTLFSEMEKSYDEFKEWNARWN